MNKILQDVLLLDTLTSRELKKAGVVTFELNGCPVTVVYDKDTKKVSHVVDAPQGEEKDFHVKQSDVIELTEADYERLENGEYLPFGKKGTIHLNDSHTKLIYTPTKVVEIKQIIYR